MHLRLSALLAIVVLVAACSPSEEPTPAPTVAPTPSPVPSLTPPTPTPAPSSTPIPSATPTPSPGPVSAAVKPKAVSANKKGVKLVFTSKFRKAAKETLRIAVPASWAARVAPQAKSAKKAGYVSVKNSGCKSAKLGKIAKSADGSFVVPVATNCKKGGSVTVTIAKLTSPRLSEMSPFALTAAKAKTTISLPVKVGDGGAVDPYDIVDLRIACTEDFSKNWGPAGLTCADAARLAVKRIVDDDKFVAARTALLLLRITARVAEPLCKDRLGCEDPAWAKLQVRMTFSDRLPLALIISRASPSDPPVASAPVPIDEALVIPTAYPPDPRDGSATLPADAPASLLDRGPAAYCGAETSVGAPVAAVRSCFVARILYNEPAEFLETRVDGANHVYRALWRMEMRGPIRRYEPVLDASGATTGWRVATCLTPILYPDLPARFACGFEETFAPVVE